MPITQALCLSFKTEILGGVHDLDTDVIKMALFTSSATLGASTTAYTTSNEVSSSGTNYTTGGNVMDDPVISLDGTTAIIDFDDVVWSNASFTARGALIYNSSKADRAIAVLDFGADKTSTNGDFTVILPAPAAATAIIRIA
jgi:hypothetical protein